jgi:hypothetical protein
MPTTSPTLTIPTSRPVALHEAGRKRVTAQELVRGELFTTARRLQKRSRPGKQLVIPAHQDEAGEPHLRRDALR